MAEKFYASLKPSETAIFRAAADIYAGYVAAGAVTEENEEEMIARCVATSIRLCDAVDNSVRSDEEML